MRIYFAASIRAGRQDRELYLRLIELLRSYGEVLTEHIGDAFLEENEDRAVTTATSIFQRDISWLEAADVVIAETTTPSLGVGYEIGIAEKIGKPTICFYRTIDGKPLSAMLLGNPKLVVHEYKDTENFGDVKEILDRFFENPINPS